jgi:hypothetical protein
MSVSRLNCIAVNGGMVPRLSGARVSLRRARSLHVPYKFVAGAVLWPEASIGPSSLPPRARQSNTQGRRRCGGRDRSAKDAKLGHRRGLLGAVNWASVWRCDVALELGVCVRSLGGGVSAPGASELLAAVAVSPLVHPSPWAADFSFSFSGEQALLPLYYRILRIGPIEFKFGGRNGTQPLHRPWRRRVWPPGRASAQWRCADRWSFMQRSWLEQRVPVGLDQPAPFDQDLTNGGWSGCFKSGALILDPTVAWES